MRGPLRHGFLDLDRCCNGVHDTGELSQQPITHQLDDAAAMAF